MAKGRVGRVASALRFPIGVLLAVTSVAAATAPGWAFPGFGAMEAPSKSAAPRIVRLPGSRVAFQPSDFDDMTRAIDWFPTAHLPAPDPVAHARGAGALACGYCHLPDGRGRPENASLRGLPVDYITTQVAAFANGTRRAASPGYPPSRYMAVAAHGVSPADLAAAAAYFSRFEPMTHTRVVEAATIPAATPWRFVYRFDRTRREPLGARIVEGPLDPERSELRDPETRYVAYVPEGAVGRGQAIAAHGASGGPACMSCHGPALAGIAGASPTYLARQLLGFRSKSRDDPDAASMQAVAAHLTDAQIIDVAAYVGAHRPWTHADTPKTNGGT